MVSEEAIDEFAKLSSQDRLRWLDETRAFLSQAMPLRSKKLYEEFRKRGYG